MLAPTAIEFEMPVMVLTASLVTVSLAVSEAYGVMESVAVPVPLLAAGPNDADEPYKGALPSGLFEKPVTVTATFWPPYLLMKLPYLSKALTVILKGVPATAVVGADTAYEPTVCELARTLI